MLPMNPFQLLGQPQIFALDAEKLEAAYREVQKKVHPDRFANASDAEKRVAQQWSGFANEAYATLSNPALRAKLLAELQGKAFDENQSGNLSEDFLMAQLERREMLEEALESKDEAALKAVSESVQADYAALCAALTEAIDVQHDFTAVADLVRQLLFVQKQKLLLEKA